MNTQEMIALVRSFSRATVPISSSSTTASTTPPRPCWNARPTLTTNEINRVREFNLLQSPARLPAALVGFLVKNSASYRFAESVGRRLAWTAEKVPESGRARIWTNLRKQVL